MGPVRSFALVPAAGQSLRMGQPKLLLPWGRSTVIEQTLAAWQAGGVTATIVVVSPGHPRLADRVEAAGAQLVIPDVPPPEMKISVRHGLEFVAAKYRPGPLDVWLLAPADMPMLSTEVIQQLLHAHNPTSPAILVPTHRGRRGHPVLFPWPCAAQVAALGAHEGLNLLVRRGPTRQLETELPSILDDLDTPDDYRRLRPGGGAS